MDNSDDENKPGKPIFLFIRWISEQELSDFCATIHAEGSVVFEAKEWIGQNTLEPYPVAGSACRFRRVVR